MVLDVEVEPMVEVRGVTDPHCGYVYLGAVALHRPAPESCAEDEDIGMRS
jgi:predicted class III extradiol MEMO1 family dioxygenase